MTTKRIIYTRPDGSVSVIAPAPEYIVCFESVDDALAAIARKDISDGAADIQVVSVEHIPTDRVFRNAWERDLSPSPDAIRINMSKARVIHMDLVRIARNAELAALDIEHQRADEQNDEDRKVKIAAKKQALRDLPATFDLTQYDTPDKLKAAWPDELKCQRALEAIARNAS